MGTESTALDRAKLEQKDRAELAAIVEAMGGKATSRAKKADLVAQVLALAGVPDETAAPEPEPAPAPAEAPVAEAPAQPEPEPEVDAGGPALPEPGVVVPEGAEGEEGLSEWELEFATDAMAAGGGNRNGGQPAGGEEGEPGSRRRRRRGRNRDGQAGEGQGGGQQGQAGPQGGGHQERQQDRQQGQGDDFAGDPVEVDGYLDLRDEGYGFLRVRGYLASRDDVYVSVKQVRQFGLRKGDHLKGASRPATRNEKNPALLRVDAVNGANPESARDRRRFEDLTAIFPDQKLVMELPDDPSNLTARIIDLITPIGRGQRGLIVSPPKAGKTSVMKQIARSIELNAPDVHLIVLLVDERPEEVTDFRKWLHRGEVAASTFDRPAEEHTLVAELTIERAKRMVEEGKDVVVILDGITRLARAYNVTAPQTGRTMSGGIDASALYPPKKFFGAARNCEEGGSLTILATALVETGSRMDEHIFEEFKGTGNMELKLDRRLAERRVYPAIDVDASSTRHEELLLARTHLAAVWKVRKAVNALTADGANPEKGLELLLDRMRTFRTNAEFLAEVQKAPTGM